MSFAAAGLAAASAGGLLERKASLQAAGPAGRCCRGLAVTPDQARDRLATA